MSVELVAQESYQIGGETVRRNKTIDGDVAILIDEDIPAAKTGTLTTRTDNTDGTLTMAAGHGITTGARLDLYWNGGSRRGVVVGTVATNSVPISGGSGDNLPIATTVITAMVPIEKTVVFDGDDPIAIVCGTKAKGTFVFADDADAELAFRVLDVDSANNGAWAWTNDNGYTSPLAGDAVDSVFLSHGDSTGTKNMKVLVMLP